MGASRRKLKFALLGVIFGVFASFSPQSDAASQNVEILDYVLTSRDEIPAIPAAVSAAGTSASGISLVSLSSAEEQSDGPSEFSDLSDDGGVVAFESAASNLSTTENNGTWDVFLRDVFGGTTTQASVNNLGEGADGSSFDPQLSADGLVVAFQSRASNLDAFDFSNSDIFIRDARVSPPQTTRASFNNDGESQRPSISADGRFVAFDSTDRLVPLDTDNFLDVYVYDREEDVLEIVSRNNAGAKGNSNSYAASVSGDGRFIAFVSTATNYVPGDNNFANDVFLRDMQLNQTLLISRATDGTVAGCDSFHPSISEDGYAIAFTSCAIDLVEPLEFTPHFQVFLRDRAEERTVLVSRSVDDETLYGNEDSADAEISLDGSAIVFTSFATDLGPADANAHTDIYRFRRDSEEIDRVTVTGSLFETSGASQVANTNADGMFVSFFSDDVFMVEDDNNAERDVFLRDMCSGAPCSTAPVVVLVHGYDRNKDEKTCGMEGLAAWLRDSDNTGGQQFWVRCLRFRTREGVASAAHDLSALINRMSVEQVDIVAHSAGGLVSRYYIENLKDAEGVPGRERVRSLTMLGTPNWGTHIADHPCAWSLLPFTTEDHGACDLVPGSLLFWDLNLTPSSHAPATYSVITGWIGPPIPGVLSRPNDCIVEVASAEGLFFDTTVRAVSHVHQLPLCVGTGEMDDDGVRQQVAEILLDSNGVASLMEVTGAGSGAPPPSPAPSVLASQSGVINDGTTIDFAVTIPASQPEALFRFATPSDPAALLTFSVLRPGGVPVSLSDSDVMTQDGENALGVREAMFRLTAPAAGVWTMRVSATSAPPGGWPYDLRALIPDGIEVVASAGAGHYDVGVPVPLSAHVVNGGIAVTNAVVTAAVRKPDGTQSFVPLTADGLGAYDGTYSDNSACGLYAVTVAAVLPSGATRIAHALMFAAVPGNLILDPCVADSDGDGLSDEVEGSNSSPGVADTDGDGVSDGPLASQGALSGPDNCASAENWLQANTDLANASLFPGSDALGDACDADDDADGCTDFEEINNAINFGGQRDALNPWDFADVPTPAYPSSGTKGRFINLTDVGATLSWVGRSNFNGAGPDGRNYVADHNSNGVADGTEYDRTPNGSVSGAPNGAITLSDVGVVLGQVGHSCLLPPN